MWAVVANNLLLLLGALALLLVFLYIMARMLLSHRKAGEDASMRLLWLFKFEICGHKAEPTTEPSPVDESPRDQR